MTSPAVPVILAFSGHDPTGGAGIAADITAIRAQGCHCFPVVTTLTVQDTGNVHEVSAVDAELVYRQARVLLNDTRVSAFKIGICGSVANLQMIASLLDEYPEIPVVTDPVLRAGGGFDLADDAMVEALRSLLVPRSTLVLPNLAELEALAPEPGDAASRAANLVDAGCTWVLVTAADSGADPVVNTLYGPEGEAIAYSWPRLHGTFHGSGCTLAAATAARLARHGDMKTSVEAGQRYTWGCLDRAIRIGAGQAIPAR